jgi:hypothetical protein
LIKVRKRFSNLTAGKIGDPAIWCGKQSDAGKFWIFTHIKPMLGVGWDTD